MQTVPNRLISGVADMKKLMACLFMVLNHIALYYADKLPPKLCIVFQVIGSLALPLFAYSFAKGFFHTRNAGIYFLRLFALAMLTEAMITAVLPDAGLSAASFPLNSVFVLLCAFGLLYGCELLFAIPADRIGSLRLLEANAHTHSDRYDVRIGNGFTAGSDGYAIRIPPLSPAGLFWLALLIIVPSVVLSVFLNSEYGLFGVLTALIFYFVEKSIPKNKGTWAFVLFLGFDFIYTAIYYLCTKTLNPLGASVAAIFLCYLPEKKKRPSPYISYAFYLFFPLHILILLLLRPLF